MHNSRWPQHGPVRRWRGFFRVWCRCGLEAYPCAVLIAQQRQRAAVDEARSWRDDERRTSGFGGEL